MTVISPEVATEWLRRWDAQQEFYIADREERFTVIGDVVEHVKAARVLDLGCGPGSLSARLSGRLPSAEIIGVDSDPLLLALARSSAPAAIRFVDTDLSKAGWAAALELDGGIDAAVSTTALHWLAEPDLARLYADLAGLIRPGGVLVNGDHMTSSQPGITGIEEVVRQRRASRQGVVDNEDWASWWEALAAEEAFAGLLAERRERGIGSHEMGIGFDGHVDLLRQAGFREVGSVWQSGDDHVLVAIR